MRVGNKFYELIEKVRMLTFNLAKPHYECFIPVITLPNPKKELSFCSAI